MNVRLAGAEITYTDSMGKPTEAMHELAHKLVALEEGSELGSEIGTIAAIRVIEKLRILLIRFSGPEGFGALIRRAIALSRAEDSSLHGRTLTSDGSVASLVGVSKETGVLIIAHLLDLMSTFIGQALTISLLTENWPADTF